MRSPSPQAPDIVAAAPPARPADSMRGQALLVLQVILLLSMVAIVVTRLWVDHLWLAFTLTAVTAAVWSPELVLRRPRIWMFSYVAGTFVYTLLRSFADDTVVPIRTEYVIDLDRTLFFGELPGVVMQREFFRPPTVGLLEWGAVLLHWSFFVAPHALALYVFTFRRRLFPRYCGLTLLVLYVALALFFLVPTTPPWLAGLQGDLPIEGSYRVMEFAGSSLNTAAYDSLYQSLGEPNSVAAMPSLHLGLTFAMYLFARRHLPRLGIPLLVYSVLMGVALVYMAEHYVSDLLAGAGCALVAYLVVESPTVRRWLAGLRQDVSAFRPS